MALVDTTQQCEGSTESRSSACCSAARARDRSAGELGARCPTALTSVATYPAFESQALAHGSFCFSSSHDVVAEIDMLDVSVPAARDNTDRIEMRAELQRYACTQPYSTAASD